MDTDEVMTEAQAAEFLHQKPRTLRLWRNQRGLPHFKPTQKVVLYPKSDLLDWLARYRVAMTCFPGERRGRKR